MHGLSGYWFVAPGVANFATSASRDGKTSNAQKLLLPKQRVAPEPSTGAEDSDPARKLRPGGEIIDRSPRLPRDAPNSGAAHAERLGLPWVFTHVSGPPFTPVGRMVIHLMAELEARTRAGMVIAGRRGRAQVIAATKGRHPRSPATWLSPSPRRRRAGWSACRGRSNGRRA